MNSSGNEIITAVDDHRTETDRQLLAGCYYYSSSGGGGMQRGEYDSRSFLWPQTVNQTDRQKVRIINGRHLVLHIASSKKKTEGQT